jgi:sarcosine oxidase subunit alpha
MSDTITIAVNGAKIAVKRSCSVATAVMNAGESWLRTSVTGQARGPLCGMGICFECRLTINGQAQQRSCQILCEDGMDIRTR